MASIAGTKKCTKCRKNVSRDKYYSACRSCEECFAETFFCAYCRDKLCKCKCEYRDDPLNDPESGLRKTPGQIICRFCKEPGPSEDICDSCGCCHQCCQSDEHCPLCDSSYVLCCCQ